MNERLIENAPMMRSSIQEELPVQKFPRGTKVKIRFSAAEKRMLSHFKYDCDAIVQYTHAQKCDGDDVKRYYLLILDESGKALHAAGWYQEEHLTLVSDDIKSGINIINKWRTRKKSPEFTWNNHSPYYTCMELYKYTDICPSLFNDGLNFIVDSLGTQGLIKYVDITKLNGDKQEEIRHILENTLIDELLKLDRDEEE